MGPTGGRGKAWVCKRADVGLVPLAWKEGPECVELGHDCPARKHVDRCAVVGAPGEGERNRGGDRVMDEPWQQQQQQQERGSSSRQVAEA